MPFQPLIVVILLIFLVLLSFALFIWSLLSMGSAKNQEIKVKNVTSENKKEKPENIGYLKKEEQAKQARRKARQQARKPKPSIKPKPTIPPYQELRPISKNRASGTANNAKQRINDIKTAESSPLKPGSYKPEPVDRSLAKIKDIKLVENIDKKVNNSKKLSNSKKEITQPKLDEVKTDTKNDNYRGLNADNPKRPKDKIDPFDSFVEASKKLS